MVNVRHTPPLIFLPCILSLLTSIREAKPMFYWVAFHPGANVLCLHKHNLCGVAFQLRKSGLVGGCCHLRGADGLGQPLLAVHVNAEGEAQ